MKNSDKLLAIRTIVELNEAENATNDKLNETKTVIIATFKKAV